MIDWIAAHLHSRPARYLISVIALLVAAALTIFIIHFNLPRQVTGYAFLLVIIGSAWWGGYGPGLLTTCATLLLGPYLTQPAYSIRHPNLGSAPMVVLISVLISRMASARQTLKEANEMLDERVRQRTAELETANGALRDREAQLMAQAERLSESNADLEQFAYFASHDLQEPLRMISIYTELLKENQSPHSDASSVKYLQTVRESISRLEVLVNDLLVYSRAIHDDPAGARMETDSHAALLIAINNLDAQILKEGARISSGNLPMVAGHSVHLIQIFQNLIGNALKYRSEATPGIEVHATKRDNEWIFSVRDNGIGISPDYHEKIFVPFKRLHGQQYPGSGVGLAICRRIVERLGGRIWVESQLGGGATFYFSISPPSPENEVIHESPAAARQE